MNIESHPAHPGNYTKGRQGTKVDRIVIHVADGSYAGTNAWFADPKCDTSAHYTIAMDGRVARNVADADTAWNPRAVVEPSRTPEQVAAARTTWERALERAVELEPRNSTVNDHLGDVYWAAGRQREAQFQWRRALGLDPEPEEAARLEAKLRDGLPAPPAATAQR